MDTLQQQRSLQIGLPAKTTNQVAFEPLVVSAGAAQAVLDGIPTRVVVWDEISNELAVHEGLLQQLAHGTDKEMQCKQVRLEASIMFEEMHQGGEDLTGKEVVWDEELIHNIDSHDGLLQQLAHGVSDQLQCKQDVVVPDTPNMFVGVSQVKASKIVQADQISSRPQANVATVVWDEEVQCMLDQHSLVKQLALDNDCLVHEEIKSIGKSVIGNVLTQDNCSSFILGVGIDVSEDDKRLELKVVDDDKFYKEMFFKAIENWKLGERGADFACVGQKMDCDRQNLVFFDERQEKGSTQYVIAEIPPWSQNAFNAGNCDLELELAHFLLDKTLSGRRNGFSPGSCELNRRSIIVTSDLQFSYEAFTFVYFADAYLIDELTCISVMQWDPGIWHQLNNKAFKSEIYDDAYLMDLKHKRVVPIRNWDPGILRYPTSCIHNNFSSDQFAHSCVTLIVHLLNGWSPYLPQSDEIKTLLLLFEQSMDPMPSDLETPDSSLHQQAMCAGYLNDVIWEGDNNMCALSNTYGLRPLNNSTIQVGGFNIAASQHPRLCKMASSVRRQWDPGITCYDIVWKQLMNTATAWGQAVFRGGGNVMTQIWPRRSPRLSSPSDGPSRSPRSKARDDCVYKAAARGGRDHRSEIQKQNQRGKREERLPPQASG